ncbi:MAG: hypothetical protein AB1627_01235 [Chloroflexota bacterium]
MTKIRVSQVAFIEGTAFVFGRPVTDPTKVLIGAAEVRGAMVMAIDLQAGPIIVDMPDEAVVDILEIDPSADEG